MTDFDYPGRIEGLRGRFKPLGVDGMLLHGPESRRYFSGFTGSHGWLIVDAGKKILFTDQRYTEQAGLESPGWAVVGCGIDRLGDLARVLEDSGIARLGFEAETLTVAEYNTLKDKLDGVTLVPTENLSLSLRSVKDPGEQDLVRKALRIAEAAFRRLVEDLRPGMTEAEIARRLDALMVEEGAEGPSFDTIAAAGVNSSKPHHSPGADTIGEHDALLLDFGARYEGYCSDITRMVFTGAVPKGFEDLLAATEKALRTVEEELKPGMTGAEADAVARRVYENRSLEQYTLRGLGHGVGLAIHEWPRVVMADDTVLEPGMICTLEPGVYLPGRAGVRIEDLALITETGVEILNTTPWTATLNKEQWRQL